MRNIIITLLLLLPNFSSSQEKDYISEMLAAHNGISQKEGTEEELKKLLGIYGENQKEVFAILFSPQVCPRCEVDITFVLDNIKKIKPETPVAVIASYPDGDMARKYVKEKYNTDNIIVDTNNIHEKIFHYRAGRLSVTYLLQINAKEGRLMCGGDSPTMSTAFLEQFCNNTAYMPYSTNDAKKHKEETGIKTYKETGTYSSINIKQSKDFSISNILEYPEWNSNTFLFADELSSKGLMFKIKDDTAYFEKDILPTDTQEKAFSKIPVTEFEKMKQEGLIFIMANCVAITPETGEAMVSYSLPDMSFENDSSIAYYNKPVLLETMAESDSCNMYAFDFEHDADTLYMYTHASRIMPINNKHIMIGCKRGFPTTCSVEDCRKDDLQNIFNDKFYGNSPIIAIFDKTTGTLVKRFGHLDNIFSKTKTGYFFTVPTADTYNNKVIYSDGCSGKLWIDNLKTGVTENEITIFEVNIPDGLLNDTKKLQYTDDYFNSFFSVFNQYIEVVKADTKGIHCLVRKGNNTIKDKNDKYEYLQLSHKGKIKNRLHLEFERGDEVLSINMGKDNNNNVFLYYMCKNGDNYYLKKIK